MKINLSSKVSPYFRRFFKKFLDCYYDLVVMKGGRHGGKSVFIATVIVLGVMTHKESAICLMQYHSDLKDKLVDNFTFVIDMLGVSEYWKLRKNKYEYVLLDRNGKETNISIKFFGCDKAESSKGFKSRKGGGFKYIWFEEITKFSGQNTINGIIDSCNRLDGRASVFYSYNPPKETGHWSNENYNLPDEDDVIITDRVFEKHFEFIRDGISKKSVTLVLDSNMYDLPKEWVNDEIWAKAEQARIENTEFWEWNYLGNVVGTSANVFRNVRDWTYTEDINIKNIVRGLDCSNGGEDPWMYGAWYYDEKNRYLYCLDEFVLGGKSDLDDISTQIKIHNENNLPVFIDSAVPFYKDQLRKRQLNILPAKKFNDNGIMPRVIWLQSLNGIFIDKRRCPITYKEFKNYCWKLDKDDEITSVLPDKNNHSIDACGYANSFNIKYKV